ncbi:MAG: hypothetical protein IJA70_03295 [Oscillospiraceae bacterium]|nr:hypothetical protein [Oscillospiraceae bacterium]
MPSCMFIGDHEASQETYHTLIAVIEELIVNEKVSTFYVGDKGSFDSYTQTALRLLQKKYPYIKCFIVLAYIPGKQNSFELPPILETIYPEGLEKTPLRYAINQRNLWMLKNSSFVVACPSAFGNSSKIVAKARLSGKTVIDISAETRNIFPYP